MAYALARRRRGRGPNIIDFRQMVVEKMLADGSGRPTKEDLVAAADVLLAPLPSRGASARAKEVKARAEAKVRTPRPRPGRAFVYVIGPANGPVKIGFAKDVKSRLTDLQIGSPVNLVLHGAVSSEFASKVERRCHKALADHHLRGEWFDVDPARAVRIVEREAFDTEAAA